MAKIVDKDIVGARASNAGDRFHELWALRKALSLLEPNSPYQAITVEGVPQSDMTHSSGSWSAVDVCLMSDGTSLSSARCVEFAQLKYSSSNPMSPWTTARLVSSSAKKGNNSVARKLAELYKAAEITRSTDNPELSYSIRLVSNQPVGVDVLHAFGKSPASAPNAKASTENDKATLLSATGLTKNQFDHFSSMLDFSECGAKSLFDQERFAIQALDRMIEGDSRPSHLELLRFISDEMLPSGSRQPITEETLLSRLGIGTERALYPCPNMVMPVSAVVERSVSKDIAGKLVSGVQRIGVHGGAGCGKTTTIGQIATLLPPGSVCIQYDCYGGGSYLDDSAPRHRPIEAFTQLSNEIATKLRIPRLLRTTDQGNPARAFKERLDFGAEVLRESNPDALLVVAVDAADNAVTAATRRGEHCFVHELVSMADLPSNVRVVISARTTRLDELQLPPGFIYQQIDPFNLGETSTNVRRLIALPDVNWIKEFHDMTRGNPRVQAYAFEFSTRPEEAIQSLLPNGKGLGDIFERSIETAWRKGGEPRPISLLCAALVSLPRPVPLDELAHAIQRDLTWTMDLCEDLSPTLVIRDNVVSFSDEDFEDFVGERGRPELNHIQVRIAEHLLVQARHSAYAARHVVQALICAGREQEALHVAMEEPEPTLFPDPVERRLCQLDRMRSALHVCGQTGNLVDSLIILLKGAEALRTSDAIARELARNPDLAVRYARASVEKLVLADENYIEAHGPVLCHYMAEDSKNHVFIQVERSRRLFFSWQSRRLDDSSYRQHSQELTVADIAAFCRAQFATSGLGATIGIFRSLRRNRLAVVLEFAARLLGQGNVAVLEKALSHAYIPSEAGLYLAGMLAKAGGAIDLEWAEKLLRRLQARGVFRARSDHSGSGRFFSIVKLMGCALDLCEIMVRSGRSLDVVRSVLCDLILIERPRWKNIELSSNDQIDALLRAECMLAELSGQPLSTQSILDVVSKETSGWSSDSGISYEDHQKQSDIVGLFSAHLPFYQARARYIKSACADEFLGMGKTTWMDKVMYATSSGSRRNNRGMRYRAAESVSSLVAVSDGKIQDLFEVVKELLITEQASFGSHDAEILRPFTWRHEAYECLTEFAEERQSKISDLKTSSSEKASALLELSRLLLDCSQLTSASLFNAAVLVLGEIDVNEMRLLGTFDKLAKVASSALDATKSHQTAVALASYGTAVAFRLRDFDHFPWRKLSRALTHLSVPVALAAAARWDDEDLATISETLQFVLIAGLNASSIPVQYASACCYLFKSVPESLVSEILRGAPSLDEGVCVTVHEILAECETLDPGPTPRSKIEAAIVGGIPVEKRGRWSTYLSEKCALLQEIDISAHATKNESMRDDDKYREKLHSFLENLDWSGHTFDSAANISEFTRQAYASARGEKSLNFIGQELYRRIRVSVLAHRRSEYLSALAEIIRDKDSSYDATEALVDGIVAWYPTSLTVRDWCVPNLPSLISAKLMEFMLVLHEKSPLSRLIEAGCINQESLYRALLVGLAENLEEFDAAKIYDLVDVIAGLLPASDVANALKRYADRLTVRVAADDRLDSSDIPESVDEAFARFLYAYLSDADLAVRWRGAHSVRSLFWLETSSVLEQLVSRYEIVSERSFRATGAPFYWLAARLWLTIGISRACLDRPSYAAQYAGYLFSVLNDTEFPHIPLRVFAKQGVLMLKDSGVLRLTREQSRLLAAADGSRLPKKRRPRELDRGDNRTARPEQERRFHFDGLDTLRYWYPSMARMFADVSLIDFVDEVERWIIDIWGVKSNPWRWDQEPRRAKFDRNPYAMSHSHGELPRVERFHTHLEWHGMWCAAGELLKSQSLATSEYGDDCLREELQSATVVAPSLWASDLRSPKPLEERFWMPLTTGLSWVCEPSLDDVFDLLGLHSGRGWCVVSGHYDRYWLGMHERVHVSSCFVSPATAPALLRALQSSNNVHGYRLPLADDNDDNIDLPPFKLNGWLTRSEEKMGLDSKDDSAEGISSRVMQPGETVRKTLGLKPSDNFLFGWESASVLVFCSEQWADKITDRHYWEQSDCVRSKGERLHCALRVIEQTLCEEQSDLLIKVQTYRKEYEEYQYSESEKGESAYFNRYILLTNQGYIKDVTGYVGTWKVTG